MHWVIGAAFGVLACVVTAAQAAGVQDGLQAWHAGDRDTALAHWRAAAAQGDGEASLLLGYVFRRGLGVARDEAQAVRWYREAAQRGSAAAQYELALMYELGLGVAQDSDAAAQWYGLSAAQACPGELDAERHWGLR